MAEAMATVTSIPEDKLDFKKILPVFVIVLIDLLGLTVIIPLLPLYAVSFGANAFVIGLLGATYPVMQFFGAPFLGRLSDRYGRRPVLLISQIGTLIGFVTLGFSRTLGLVFVARVIDGLSGANIPTAQAVITDSTTPRTRTQGLGLIGAAFGLGFVVGPIIAFISLSLSGNNYAVPAFIAAGFSLTSIVLTWFWLPETLLVEQRSKTLKRGTLSFRAMLEALVRKDVGILLILLAMQQLAFGGFQSLLSLFTLNRLGFDARDNSGFFVFVGVIIVAVQGYFIGRWSRKLGERKLIYMGLGLLAVGLILTALTPHQPAPWYSPDRLQAELVSGSGARGHELPPTQSIPVDLPGDTGTGWLGVTWLLVAMIPAAIGGGMLQPSVNSLLTKRVETDEIGGILGISSAFLSGANAMAPVVLGAIFQRFGSTAPFLSGGLLLTVLTLLAFRLLKPGREEQLAPGLARGGAAH